MPVNLVQCRGTVGAFNNREIFSHNRPNLFSKKICIKFLIEKIILVLLSVFGNSIQFITRYVSSLLFNILYLTSITVYTYHIWLYFIIIKRSGDLEENPGPHYNSCQSFSIFHSNLDSICAHNFIKLSILRAYIPANQCDIFCLS